MFDFHILFFSGYEWFVNRNQIDFA